MIPVSGPCRRYGEEAPFCVIGIDPDRSGGGVLYWAWSREEASKAAEAYRENGFHDIHVKDAMSEETTKEVHSIVFGLLEAS